MRNYWLVGALLFLSWPTHAEDRIELDPSRITGNMENPNVLYVVPWRPLRESQSRAMALESLMGEVFEPIDRDSFVRRVDEKEKKQK